jgi:hypothetical protein
MCGVVVNLPLHPVAGRFRDPRNSLGARSLTPFKLRGVCQTRILTAARAKPPETRKAYPVMHAALIEDCRNHKPGNNPHAVPRGIDNGHLLTTRFNIQTREENDWPADFSLRAVVQLDGVLVMRNLQLLPESSAGTRRTESSTGRRSITSGWACTSISEERRPGAGEIAEAREKRDARSPERGKGDAPSARSPRSGRPYLNVARSARDSRRHRAMPGNSSMLPSATVAPSPIWIRGHDHRRRRDVHAGRPWHVDAR